MPVSFRNADTDYRELTPDQKKKAEENARLMRKRPIIKPGEYRPDSITIKKTKKIQGGGSGGAPVKYLMFNATTYIDISGVSLAATELLSLEWEFNTSHSGSNQYCFTTESTDYGRVNLTNTMRYKWGGSNSVFALPVLTDTWYRSLFKHVGAGACNAELETIGGATATDSKSLATVGSSTVFRIGSNYPTPGNGMIGIIKDFKIFDDVGTLLNHWPINDDVEDGGTIKDIVGGKDGILTLGAGSWVDA